MRSHALAALAFLQLVTASVNPIVRVGVASPAGAARAGDAVRIDWAFLPGHAPVAGDFIGAFASSGAEGAPEARTVTARQCLSAACRDSRPVPLAAAGTLDFGALVHARANYTFLYFSPSRAAGCWDTPALASSRALAFADDNEPTGVHLSLTGRAGEAVVSFSTKGGQPAVRFGTGGAGGALPRLAVGVSATFTASDLCGAPANDSASGDFVVPYSLNAVTLSGLRAHEVVEYQAGTLNGTFGKRWSFTMPAVGADASAAHGQHGPPRERQQGRPLRLAVFGDMGQDLSYNDRVGSQPAASATLASILRQDPALVLHVGDLSYARGSGSMWPAFFQQAQDVAATRPYLTGIGNHEFDYPGQAFNWTRGPDSGGECGVPYSTHFTNPSPSSKSNTSPNPGAGAGGAAAVHWWSLELEHMHLVVLSSEADWTEGSAQHTWLAADLAAVDRARTPFVVLCTHRPFYSSGNGWLSDAYSVAYQAAQRAAVEPLLKAFKVDLAIVGHVHLRVKQSGKTPTPSVGGHLDFVGVSARAEVLTTFALLATRMTLRRVTPGVFVIVMKRCPPISVRS